MPFINEHAVRLIDPDKIKPKSFKRTWGSGALLVQGVKIPKTIGIIWGNLKENNDFVAQSLRFPVEKWTKKEVLKWVYSHNIIFINHIYNFS